jgi:hypothetical protein
MFATITLVLFALLLGAALCLAGYRFFLVMLPIWGFFGGFWIGAEATSLLLGGGFLATTTGLVVGLAAGICFVGVALTPANLVLEAHLAIMMWSFRAFTVAVICYTIAIFRQPDYPNVFGFIFVAFAVLLVLYVLLLIAGPPYDSPEGITIQAVGQKTIVYASVTSVFIQAYGAKKLAGESLDSRKR